MKKIISILLCLMMLSVTVFASPAADVDSELRTVSVSGISETKNGLVSVIILAPTKGEGDVINPPKDMTEITYENLVSNSTMIAELETDDSGSYKGDFRLPASSPSGKYYVYVSGEDAFYFYYANAAEVAECISAVQNASEDKVGEVLFTYTVSKEILGLNLDGDYAEFSSSANKVMYEFKEDSKPETIADIKSAFEKAVEAAKYLESDAEGIEEAIEANLLGNTFADELSAEEIAKMFETVRDGGKLPSKDYADYIALTLRKASALVAINSTTRGAMTSVLEEYNDVLKLDLDGDYEKLEKNAVNKKLVDKNFKSIEAVQDAFDDAVKAAKKSESSTGSGSGLGSGSGSSHTRVEVSPDYTAPDVTDTTAPSAFTDLSDAEWAREYITSLANAGIVNGVGGGRFEPMRSVTREEFLKMLLTASGITPAYSSASFSDVESGAWYASYVLWASENGIVNGIGDGRFGIGDAITREQMAVMTVKMLEYLGKSYENGSVSFADEASVSDYAKEAVGKMVKAGILSGMPDGTFAPKANLTRAQAAKVIYMVKAGVVND